MAMVLEGALKPANGDRSIEVFGQLPGCLSDAWGASRWHPTLWTIPKPEIAKTYLVGTQAWMMVIGALSTRRAHTTHRRLV